MNSGHLVGFPSKVSKSIRDKWQDSSFFFNVFAMLKAGVGSSSDELTS